jgi:hypothetical protein
VFFFDPLYLIIAAPALIVMFYAQSKVRSAYGKYSRIRNMKGVTGLEVARILLRAYGLSKVRIQQAGGLLTDHYDPRNRILRFSGEVYASPSVAALGIVAHEVGHALQHHQGYILMKVRTALVPVANIGSYLGYIFFILGIIIGAVNLVWLGVFLFSGAVAFALVTLPVEFDASRKARLMLKGIGLISEEEEKATSAVLSAAALTYVAALLQAVASLFYFLLIALGMSRRQ